MSYPIDYYSEIGFLNEGRLSRLLKGGELKNFVLQCGTIINPTNFGERLEMTTTLVFYSEPNWEG